jgi:hypothetical protein
MGRTRIFKIVLSVFFSIRVYQVKFSVIIFVRKYQVSTSTMRFLPTLALRVEQENFIHEGHEVTQRKKLSVSSCAFVDHLIPFFEPKVRLVRVRNPHFNF